MPIPLLLFLLFSVFLPRITILLLWFFTSWFEGVWQTMIIPILGFIVMPYTTLTYSVAINWFGGVADLIPILLLIIAVVADLGQKDAIG